MRAILLGLVLLLTPLVTTTAAEETRAQVHHDLTVVIRPGAHALEVVDRVSFPQGISGLSTEDGGLGFRLHGDLRVEVEGDDLVLEEAPSDVPRSAGVPLEAYVVRRREGSWPEHPVVTLRYAGFVHQPPKSEGEEYARSFARTPGTIGEEGVVLTRATWWVPYFGEDLLDFELTVELPEGWESVSQGRRTESGWVCEHPMEEVYLIANRYHVFERAAGNVSALAYLLEPDATLAGKYLEATAQYVEMYRNLIGPYAFSKFALVENFWETGYGMPSFTLLGPRVIRMPFILHSSYPHEILHNWWGNSVYVDWQSGNWCEGLTAYLADHLIREGQGRGVQYRFDTLKKYRNYVRGTRGFPLTQFRSRHSGATEAIGYGKALMVFHMLRRRLGEAGFTRAIQSFYRQHRWTQASWADVETVFSQVAGEDLGAFFEQWVTRTGAPALAMAVEQGEGGRRTVRVRQTQEGEAYDLTVPVALTLKDRRDAVVHSIHVGQDDHMGQEGAEGQGGTLDLPEDVVRIDLDPQFDVFRRLDLAETPPTLSELFGADAVTLILPEAGTDPLASAWKTFAATWARGGGGQVEVVTEEAIQELPADRAVWVLGARNRWQAALKPALAGWAAGVEGERVDFGETRVPRAGHSFVFTARHPANEELALGWVATETEGAIPGLARKLPHYGRYSYLAFTGNAPDNVAKGQWPATASPLVVVLSKTEDGSAPPRGALPAREPLARLAPVFDAERLMGHVRVLAAETMRGRGAGDPELAQAARYIAQAFAAAGLKPGGDDGTWFQTFTEPGGPDGEPVTLENVVAVLPGTKDEWAQQSVVVGAHYDHLGRGWPDVRSGNEGKIHNGADDNASGVAVLLELAKILGAELKPERSIVFVAFSGEEWGRKGSKHYVREMRKWPATEAIGMVNLDTVGRLEGKKLMVLGSGTATEWRHIAMGVGYTTGVESNCVAEDPQGSDQVSFHEVGVPAVQLFSGAHADYHRPTDDVEKIDADGLVKVAIFTRETVVYLSQRPEPLTAKLGNGKPGKGTPGTGGAPTGKPPSAGRRVSLGTVPAFDHTGPGAKVSSVLEGSAAESAGIRADDVLLAIDGEILKGLRHYSEVLKRHAPGDVIKIRLRRGDEELEVEATLGAR